MGRIPIHVVKKDTRGSDEVEPGAAGLGAQEKHKVVAVARIELVDDFLALLSCGGAIEAEARILVVIAELLQKVKHLG